MVNFKVVALSGLCGNLREVQCFCEDVGEALPVMFVYAVKLARKVIEMKRKNAALYDQNADLDAKLAEARAVEGTMRRQLARAKL